MVDKENMDIVLGKAEHDWQFTCQKASKAVVFILAYFPRTFDTREAGNTDATGFIVNAEKGIILTNRHVAGPGPFRGRAIFQNQEAVDVKVIYYDPVHDYAFLQFDPKELKRTKVQEIALRPDLASIGMQIRVIGNESAQKLSISEGTIGRLNREAPWYPKDYTDFNINYIQGSAMTSGGSSGSPVIEIGGNAIALNAGSFKNASVACFLPLDQPVKCLQYLLKGELMPRGTIQTRWTMKPFHECQALGVTDEMVQKFQEKDPDDEGTMVVACCVLPQGPAYTKLKEGDVLLKVNGSLTSRFNYISEVLNSNVDKEIKLVVQRGNKELEILINVQNLYSITPDRYFMLARWTFHDFSYILAQRNWLAVHDAGVFTQHNCWDIGKGPHLIQSLDGKSTKNLSAFIEVLQSIPDGKMFRIGYKDLTDVNKIHYLVRTIDRRLSVIEIASLSFPKSEWIMEKLPKLQVWEPLKPHAVKVSIPPHQIYPKASNIFYSIVYVTVFQSFAMDGFTDNHTKYYGIVINDKLGLVLVSRDSIPTYFARASITFFSSIIIPAEIVFLHPVHNYAILRYDTTLVQVPVKEAKLSTERIGVGAKALFFRGGSHNRLEMCPTYVAGIYTSNVVAEISPVKRAVNREALVVDLKLESLKSGSGLVSEDGIIQAIWFSNLCIPTPSLIPIIKQVEQGLIPKIKLLGVDFQPIDILTAIAMGLSHEWVDRIEQSEFKQIFKIIKPYSGYKSEFEAGDILLNLNDKLVTSGAALFDEDIPEESHVQVLRDLEIKTFKVNAFPTKKLETTRFLVFCGSVIQQPHFAVRQMMLKLPSEVYIASWTYGSPAARWSVYARNFITEVNGVATHDLQMFLDQIKKIEDNKFFRLTLMTTQNVQFVKTLKRDELYFPLTEHIMTGPSEWKTIRHPIEVDPHNQRLSSL